MSTSNLKGKYQQVQKQLAEEFGFKNLLATPALKKVVINLGIGEGASDKGIIEKPASALGVITGQKPRTTRARGSIAGFRLRAGDPIGLMVTLRGRRMYDFLEKLFKIVLPRLRDFRGVSLKSFDGLGNYSLGISEYSVFPEINLAQVERTWGLEITIVTSAKDNQKAKRLLELLGMPFEKKERESPSISLKVNRRVKDGKKK